MGKTNSYSDEQIIEAAVEAYTEIKSLRFESFKFYCNKVNPSLPNYQTIRKRLGGWRAAQKAITDYLVNNSDVQIKKISVYKMINSVTKAMIAYGKANITGSEYRKFRKEKRPDLPSLALFRNRPIGFKRAKKLAKKKFKEYQKKNKNIAKKKKMRQFRNKNCTNCTWRIDKATSDDFTCMFRRCIKLRDWFADSEAYKEVIKNE